MDKLLFTPGPLNTSRAVKEAMLHDVGSRDADFVELVRWIRDELLALAGTSRAAGHEAVLLQGSGTYGVEAVLTSALPADGSLLLVINGAYGERMRQMAAVAGIATTVVRTSEAEVPELRAVEAALDAAPETTHVAVVHCETTTGIVNPVEDVVRLAHARGKRTIVDSMSGFGALPVDLSSLPVDFLVSSANKCIEGVPGFAFALCRRDALEECAGRARSLSLDLFAQWAGLEHNGQFRFTPPTHALLAFAEALRALAAEGGVPARRARYQRNHALLTAGMRALGFEEVVDAALQGPVITTFHHLDHPRFSFDALYAGLSARGFVIYPGKLGDLPCFRIGTCGQLHPEHVDALLVAIRAVLSEQGVQVPGASAEPSAHGG